MLPLRCGPLLEDPDPTAECGGREQERAPSVGQFPGQPYRGRSERGEVDRERGRGIGGQAQGSVFSGR